MLIFQKKGYDRFSPHNCNNCTFFLLSLLCNMQKKLISELLWYTYEIVCLINHYFITFYIRIFICKITRLIRCHSLNINIEPSPFMIYISLIANYISFLYLDSWWQSFPRFIISRAQIIIGMLIPLSQSAPHIRFCKWIFWGDVYILLHISSSNILE